MGTSGKSGAERAGAGSGGGRGAFGRLETRFGTLQVVAGPRGLLRIDLPGMPPADPGRVAASAGFAPDVVEGGSVVEAALGQLAEYLAGTRREFDLPLHSRGGAFDRTVWAVVGAVGYGEVVTYGEIARAVGRPNAFRAVGAANGRNPLPIVVPCHRVVGSGGRLTGYGGGLSLKEALLSLEGVSVAGGRAAAATGQASISPSRMA